MGHAHLYWIANFIWGIADDVFRDVYAHGEYRGVILSMVVIRRPDAAAVLAKEGDPEALPQEGEGLLQQVVDDGDDR